ncbi:MAG: 30S ribosomal protein S13, partial [Candidatus ainarchaeum sp.]|nr:30S ribosomal protein S13 [Candidatus ainarchaeum sp.]
MPRVLGVHIPDDKKIEFALTYVYGIGRTLSKKILEDAKISLDKRAKDLTQDELNKIKEIVEANYLVEGDLKREVMMNVKRLKDINSWRGSRHSK